MQNIKNIRRSKSFTEMSDNKYRRNKTMKSQFYN